MIPVTGHIQAHVKPLSFNEVTSVLASVEKKTIYVPGWCDINCH